MSDKKSDDDNRPASNHPAGNQSGSPSSRGRMMMLPEIEENLKRVYQASLTEAVPDRFAKLLAQLREKEGKQ